MTATEQMALIGTTVSVRAAQPGLSFLATVGDVRSAYGKVKYLVAPIAGTGSAWVDATSTTVAP